MMDRLPFKELAVESMRRDERLLRLHPSSEELLLFRKGGLPSKDAEEVLDHLGKCRDCTDQMLFYAEFPVSFSDRVFAAFLRWLRTIKGWFLSGDHALSNLGRGVLIGAAVVAVVVPSVRLHRAQRLIVELSEPQGHVEIFHLEPATRRLDPRRADTQLFKVGSEDHFFAIAFPADDRCDTYAIRILNRDEDEVWAGRVRTDALGLQVRLGLSRHFLDPGDYLFEVSGFDDEVPVSTELYPIRLSYL